MSHDHAGEKLCVICIHALAEPHRPRAFAKHEPVDQKDSGLLILCDDGEDPCSKKDPDEVPISDLVTACLKCVEAGNN